MPSEQKDSSPLGFEKVSFGVWLAFLVAMITLFLVIGARHG